MRHSNSDYLSFRYDPCGEQGVKTVGIGYLGLGTTPLAAVTVHWGQGRRVRLRGTRNLGHPSVGKQNNIS